MKINLKNVSVYYEVEGQGHPLLLLHGWGQSVEAFRPIIEHLKKEFKVYTLDFPGFGQSEEPKEAWSVYDYADLVEAFIQTLNLDHPTVLGHSFGGRVGIIYAGRQKPLNKLILVDSAGVKPKRGLGYYARIYTYKLGKKVLSLPGLTIYKEKLMAQAGSSDYQQASPMMRQIMSRVVNEDLQHFMPSIQVETLLVWGELDDATPLKDAKLMEQAIPNAGLVVFEGAGHYAYLDCLAPFLRVMDVFLEHERMERTKCQSSSLEV